MNNLKISTRLILLVGVLSALLMAVGLLGLQGMGSSNDSLKTVYEDRTVALGQLAEVQFRMLSNAYLLGQVSADSTPAVLYKFGDQLDTNSNAITKVWGAYMATYLTPQEADIAKKFAEAEVAFFESRMTEIPV